MNREKLFWGDTKKAQFKPLRDNIEADYLIVGGGITGLAAAYFLTTLKKKRIVLIEKYTIGSGSTGHSAGMLVHEPEHASWYKLVLRHGVPATQAYFSAHLNAAKLVKHIIKAGGISCDIEEYDYLQLSEEAVTKASPFYKQYLLIKKYLDPKTELLADTTMQAEFSSFAYKAAKRNRQHNLSVNPLTFARGFATHLASKGVTVYENTAFDKKLPPNQIKTTYGTITFKNVLYCRGVSEPSSHLTTYLTTIGITRKLSKKGLAVTGLHDKDMFENLAKGESFHYGKVTSDNRLLIGYGDTPIRPKKAIYVSHQPHVKHIKQFLKKTFPTLDLPLTYTWSAPYALTKKSLPIVEQLSPNEIIINGAGLQLGSIAIASYGVNKLLQKPHPLDELFEK